MFMSSAEWKSGVHKIGDEACSDAGDECAADGHGHRQNAQPAHFSGTGECKGRSGLLRVCKAAFCKSGQRRFAGTDDQPAGECGDDGAVGMAENAVDRHALKLHGEIAADGRAEQAGNAAAAADDSADERDFAERRSELEKLPNRFQRLHFLHLIVDWSLSALTKSTVCSFMEISPTA